MKEYKSVHIPKDLYDEVKRTIEELDLGYRSISEFIIEATRTRLIQLRQLWQKAEHI